jgi:hypothetical protein
MTAVVKVLGVIPQSGYACLLGLNALEAQEEGKPKELHQRGGVPDNLGKLQVRKTSEASRREQVSMGVSMVRGALGSLLGRPHACCGWRGAGTRKVWGAETRTEQASTATEAHIVLEKSIACSRENRRVVQTSMIPANETSSRHQPKHTAPGQDKELKQQNNNHRGARALHVRTPACSNHNPATWHEVGMRRRSIRTNERGIGINAASVVSSAQATREDNHSLDSLA